MRHFFYLLLPLLAGCATVETRREDPAVFIGSTANSVDYFHACFFNRMLSMPRLRYRPREHGGTFRARRGLIARYVNLVIDIDDLGPARRVVVHASNSSRRLYPTVVSEVRFCLQPQ
jgi:hypothetical protein